jgi:hypothetical protein
LATQINGAGQACEDMHDCDMACGDEGLKRSAASTTLPTLAAWGFAVSGWRAVDGYSSAAIVELSSSAKPKGADAGGVEHKAALPWYSPPAHVLLRGSSPQDDRRRQASFPAPSPLLKQHYAG